MTEEEKIEAKRKWRFRWLSELFLFAHIEYQKDLWIDRKYPDEIGWFSEDICNYFDDLHLDENYEYQIKKGIISQSEFESIQGFHFALDRFIKMTYKIGEDFNDNEILEDEQWFKICQLGTRSWIRLKQIISDKDELDHMNGLERNYLTTKNEK